MLPLRPARVLLLCLALIPLTAAAWERGVVEKFATLPAGFGNPEGLTVDRHGDVYVATFAVSGTPPGQVFVFGSDGRLKRQLSVSGSSNLLLGLDFHPQTGDLLVIDFGKQQVLNVNP